MHAEIISVGNELLSGKTLNTNAAFISEHLYEIGIEIDWVTTVGDNAAGITDALRTALTRADVVLMTGGLGPTSDDITKKTLADFFRIPLVLNEEILDEIRKRFASRSMVMPENNISQAMVPEGITLLPNPVGTARGMLFSAGNKQVFSLPGVPVEMEAMIRQSVVPFLKERCPDCIVQVDLFRTTGIAESAIYERIQSELPDYFSYEIAFLPKFSGVDLRIVRRGRDIEDHEKFEKFSNLLNEKFGKYIYTTENREMEEILGELLSEKQLTIAVAESLTGGLIGDKLTNVPGSSGYFLGGVVAYSNEAKMNLLGVQKASLDNFGAVSETVAAEMARGVRDAFGSHIGISTTGIAGPSGATPEKPVGLVCIGLATDAMVRTHQLNYGKDRLINKARSAQAALEMLRRYLKGLL